MDIDSDFSKEARIFAIKYVTEFYGAKKVSGIMTMAKMGPKDALTYGPKIYAKSLGLDVKALNTIGAEMRALVGDSKHLSDIEEMVQSKYSDNKEALNVWAASKCLEGTIKSYGQHAAGIISIMEDDVEDFVPLMMAADPDGNEKMVIQADMIAAEANLGFIKFDFLGLKNLNVITACQKLIEERYGKFIDTYTLNFDDERVYKEIYASANTNFCFQFESDGMKGMLKQLNPTRFGDLVLAVSVYRPGPMQFIPDICECKRTGRKSEFIERFPVLEEVLEETYGYPVYQEQVMRIMTVCAGFDLGHADNVRRFMSKKKADKLAAEKPAFIKGCVEKLGCKEEDADWLFEKLMPFAAYGFNKSHAAAYSYVSYITAWLKLYYPEEYLCSVMLEQGDKTLQFQKECKLMGIEVGPVSVNQSMSNYSVESKGKVRIGLSAIKGLKNEADIIVDARKNGDMFSSFEDFLERCSDLKSNSLEACILSGACDEFIKNRDFALQYAKEYIDALSEIKNAAEKRAEYEQIVSEIEDPKAKASKVKTLNSWILKEEDARTRFAELKMPSCFESTNREKCAYELKYLGMFIGKSPLDDLDLTDPKYATLTDVSEGQKLTTVGIIFDYRQIKTKNNDDMAFFKILDKDSEEIECVLFPKSFEKLEFSLEDNMVIEIEGKMSTNQNDEPQIDVWKISQTESSDGILYIDASDEKLLDSVILKVLPEYFVTTGGFECILGHFMGEGVRKTKYNVKKDIIPVLEKAGVITHIG